MLQTFQSSLQYALTKALGETMNAPRSKIHHLLTVGKIPEKCTSTVKAESPSQVDSQLEFEIQNQEKSGFV